MINENVIRLHVMDSKRHLVVRNIVSERIMECVISPASSYVAVWEKPYPTTEGGNLKIFRIRDGQEMISMVQRQQTNWWPQWSEDESIMARNVADEIHLYDGHHFNLHSKLIRPQIACFSLSPGKSPCNIALFVPEVQGAPAMTQLYLSQALNVAIAQKTFYKADHVRFMWNVSGTHVLVLASTDVDTTGKSYYGETHLYLMSTDGSDRRMILDKEGPISDVAWSPNGKEFIVIYGCKLFKYERNVIVSSYLS
jgi:translation initiation factor 2A